MRERHLIRAIVQQQQQQYTPYKASLKIYGFVGRYFLYRPSLAEYYLVFWRVFIKFHKNLNHKKVTGCDFSAEE